MLEMLFKVLIAMVRNLRIKIQSVQEFSEKLSLKLDQKPTQVKQVFDNNLIWFELEIVVKLN